MQPSCVMFCDAQTVCSILGEWEEENGTDLT